MHVVTEKQHEAVLEKYRGSSHEGIASKLSVPKGTVDDWFRSRGILSPYYKEFADEMNQQRTQRIMTELRIKDVEFAIMWRKMFGRISRAVEDETLKISFMDFVRIWKMQRIEQGKPINIYSRICPCCKRERLIYRYK